MRQISHFRGAVNIHLWLCWTRLLLKAILDQEFTQLHPQKHLTIFITDSLYMRLLLLGLHHLLHISSSQSYSVNFQKFLLGVYWVSSDIFSHKVCSCTFKSMLYLAMLEFKAWAQNRKEGGGLSTRKLIFESPFITN